MTTPQPPEGEPVAREATGRTPESEDLWPVGRTRRPADAPPPDGDEQERLPSMSLMEHLEELRTRIVRSLIAFVVVLLGCWTFAKPLVRYLAGPIEKIFVEQAAAGQDPARLLVLGVPDAFLLYMKVAALAALFLSAPWILGEIWGFVSPGLYRRERRWALPFIFLGSGFFLGGGAFGFYVAFPFAIDFLIQMAGDFDLGITVERYFRFLMTVILGLGVMFEMPILIFLLSQIGVVTPRFLMRHFRWAVLAIFFLAAVITPTPDVFNLCIFALPTLALYLLGVFAAWVAQKARSRREEAEGSG